MISRFLSCRVLFALGLMASAPAAHSALLLHYTFDGGTSPVTDSGTGSPAPGTLIGAGSSLVTNTPSGSGFAFRTTGSNSYVTTGTTASPDTGTVPAKLNGLTSFTITTWVNFASIPSTNDRLVSNWTTSGGFDFRIGTAGASDFQLYLTVDSENSVGSINFSTLNSWVFLAVTYDGTTGTNNVKFYNASQSTAVGQFGLTLSNTAGTLGASGADTQVGGSPATTNDRSPNATFDDVRIYDEVLSLSQLEAIRMATVPEPSALLLSGFAGLCGLLRRRR
jgi:hypothetical protein